MLLKKIKDHFKKFQIKKEINRMIKTYNTKERKER